MKRWGVLTIALYVSALVVLTVPLFVTCFGWGRGHPGIGEAWKLMRHWGYWLWIGVATISQVLLLSVPVKIAERRPRPRRPVLVPVITATFLFALLLISLIGGVAVAGWKDNGLGIFGIFRGQDVAPLIAAFFLYVGVVWLGWALVFYRLFKNQNPETLIRRLTRWLLRGSVLELLVAVPSHVIVRNRGDCCAPGMTAWGIAAGLSVMLLSFGPGVFFLFADRARRLRPARMPMGTPPAGTRCQP